VPSSFLHALALLAAAIAFDVFCLVDLARSDEVLLLPPRVWAFVICATTPFGGISYLMLGRRR
jgi:hypothetical protein